MKGEYERDIQELLEQLRSADDTNDVEGRLGSVKAFNELKSRVDLWMQLVGELSKGPSGLQLAVVLDDLAPYWNELRKRARRQTPYAG